MVRILAVNDPDGLRALGTSQYRDLDIVHVIPDGVSHGARIEGESRGGYLFIEVPGVAPNDLVGDTGGLMPADATWASLAEPWFADVIDGVDPDGTVVTHKRVRAKRKWDLNDSIFSAAQLRRIRRDGGDTFTPLQTRTFLRARSEVK